MEQRQPAIRKSKIHDWIATKEGGGSIGGGGAMKGDGGGGGKHAVASTLRGKEGLIEYYQLYRYPKQQKRQQPQQAQPQEAKEQQQAHDQPAPIAVAIIRVGNLLDGPPNKVHGGIISLLFDDVMGFACVPLLPYAVTRDLSIRYKQPQPHRRYVQIRVFINHDKTMEYNNISSHQEGTRGNTQKKKKKKKRRLFLKATCSSLGSTATPESAPFCGICEDEILYSTATITMVQVGKATKSSHPLSKL